MKERDSRGAQTVGGTVIMKNIIRGQAVRGTVRGQGQSECADISLHTRRRAHTKCSESSWDSQCVEAARVRRQFVAQSECRHSQSAAQSECADMSLLHI